MRLLPAFFSTVLLFLNVNFVYAQPSRSFFDTKFCLSPSGLPPAEKSYDQWQIESHVELLDSEARTELHFLVSNELEQAFRSQDYWTEYANQPYTVTFNEYNGLQGVLYKQVRRICNRYYRKSLREYWEQSYLHPMDLDKAVVRFNLESDTVYHWWNRPWYRSLSVENGGERVYLNQIGSDHEIGSLGPLSIDNTGHLNWDGWDFRLTHKRESSVRNQNTRNPIVDFFDLTNDGAALSEDQERALEVGISPPIGEIKRRPNWSLRSSVRFNLRLDKMLTGDMAGNGTSVQFNLEFVGYYSAQRIPWFVARLECVAKPMKDEYEAGLMLTVLNF